MKRIRSKFAGLIPGRKSLGSKVLQAGGWSIVQIVGVNVLRLASNLILTRYLVPEAFGLMMLIGTLLTAFNLFTDIGLSQSIIRDREGEEAYFLRVAWTIKLIRGFVIAGGVLLAALGLWAFAPSLAPPQTVYADPRLPLLLALSALAPIMMGAESTTKELLTRRLQNWRFTVVEIGTQVISLIAMVIFVQFSPTVWALLAGMLLMSVIKMVASHLFYPGPWMQLAHDREIRSRFWHFGKFLMGSSSFSFIAQQADKFILAALLNATAFGLYVIAQIWALAGQAFVNQLATRVGFPAMSDIIRNRPEDLRRLFRKFQNALDVFCLGAFVVTFLLGDLLIRTLYEAEYHAAGTYLSILSLSFLIIRFRTLDNLLINMGNSRSALVISAARAILICVTIPLSYNMFGLEVTLLVVAMNAGITAPYTMILLRPTLGDKQFLYDCLWLGCSVLAAVLVYLSL
ncbi:oligosaccharide flippase family protein [Roseobacter litoralis]|uniref:oligosaccharide flippase family protein n=1 Tax=Roseobacter litoralis TaxID=42443 RepID=UPI0024950238|nr:oligosaccharide flippase family protein [Roseobacter litoralis]